MGFSDWKKNNPEKELMRIEKIRNSHIGKKFTEEHRKNLSIAKKKLAQEGKIKILNEPSWNKGKNKYNDERLRRVSELRKEQKTYLRLKEWQKKNRKNYRQTHHYSNKIGMENLTKICSRCRTDKDLCVHHIDGNVKNNSLENLKIYCRSCHFIHHGEERRMKKQIEKNVAMLNFIFNYNGGYMNIENMQHVGRVA